MENPNVGKTTSAHRLQDVTMRGLQNGAQRQRSLAPFLRQRAVTTEATTSFTLSLSLALYTVTLYTHNTITTLQPHVKVALSHIYTNMNFGLFTYVAPRALWNIFTYLFLSAGRGGYHRAFNHPVLLTFGPEGPIS